MTKAPADSDTFPQFSYISHWNQILDLTSSNLFSSDWTLARRMVCLNGVPGNTYVVSAYVFVQILVTHTITVELPQQRLDTAVPSSVSNLFMIIILFLSFSLSLCWPVCLSVSQDYRAVYLGAVFRKRKETMDGGEESGGGGEKRTGEKLPVSESGCSCPGEVN